MTIQDIEREVLSLSEKERAGLVLMLLDTLAAPGTDVSDEEVFARDAELESNRVAPMLHEEFVRRVQEERGQ